MCSVFPGQVLASKYFEEERKGQHAACTGFQFKALWEMFRKWKQLFSCVAACCLFPSVCLSLLTWNVRGGRVQRTNIFMKISFLRNWGISWVLFIKFACCQIITWILFSGLGQDSWSNNGQVKGENHRAAWKCRGYRIEKKSREKVIYRFA